jgi:uncharacterized protein YbbC (DUF1343 family)
LNGVQIFIKDYQSVNLTNTQFYIIFALKKLYPDKYLFDLASTAEVGMFIKAIGSEKIIQYYNENRNIADVISFLNKDISDFQKTASKYYIYY